MQRFANVRQIAGRVRGSFPDEASPGYRRFVLAFGPHVAAVGLIDSPALLAAISTHGRIPTCCTTRPASGSRRSSPWPAGACAPRATATTKSGQS